MPQPCSDAAAKIAKTAHKNGTTLRQEALKSGLLAAADYDRLVQPEKMILLTGRADARMSILPRAEGQGGQPGHNRLPM